MDNLAGDIIENGGLLGSAGNLLSGAYGSLYSLVRGDIFEKRRLLAQRQELLEKRGTDYLTKPGSQGYLHDLFASWW